MWSWRRQDVFKRDQGKCVRCGKELVLEYGTLKNRAECHHIMHVKEIFYFCWDLIKTWIVEDEMFKPEIKRIFAKIYTLMYLDMNNLETLCFDCHNMVHAADNRSIKHVVNNYSVAPTYWANFWRWAEKDRVTKTLDQFFNSKT